MGSSVCIVYCLFKFAYVCMCVYAALGGGGEPWLGLLPFAFVQRSSPHVCIFATVSVPLDEYTDTVTSVYL